MIVVGTVAQRHDSRVFSFDLTFDGVINGLSQSRMSGEQDCSGIDASATHQISGSMVLCK